MALATIESPTFTAGSRLIAYNIKKKNCENFVLNAVSTPFPKSNRHK
jgi:hypothetical protein